MINRVSSGYFSISILIFVIMVFFSFQTCKKSPHTRPDSFGAIINYNGCKQLSAVNNQREISVNGVNDCIEYHYDGNGTLILKHVNAGFNCCPDEIRADINCSENLIIVTEKEKEAGCLCLCLFDVDYQFQNISPGEYTIRIIEPYLESGDQILEFTVELFTATSGQYCLLRNHYPWN